MDLSFIFIIIILIFSVVIHEVSHGYVAQMLGDPTARLAGRLTLNPIKHLDPLGSVILPAILIITGANFIFGWAKPVPYNPYNLRHGRWGEAIVAGAGPLTNIILALIFGLLIRFGLFFDIFTTTSSFVTLGAYVVYINILLAIFNMIPIPPLDGSKILAAALPHNAYQSYMRFQEMMTRFGFIGMLLFFFIFIYLLWPFISVFISFFFTLITGI